MKNPLLILLVAALALMSLGGCASTNGSAGGTTKYEQLLSSAGFNLKLADTPEKLAHFQTLPPKQLVTRQKDGRLYYVYADPDQKAVYIGNEQAYQRLQDLQAIQKQQAAQQVRRASEMVEHDDLMWNTWGSQGLWR